MNTKILKSIENICEYLKENNDDIKSNEWYVFSTKFKRLENGSYDITPPDIFFELKKRNFKGEE